MLKLSFRIAGISLLFVIAIAAFYSFGTKKSVVDLNGDLRVEGNKIVNSQGEQLSLAGNSFFWSNTTMEGAKFYNKSVVKWLKDDWNTKIVRVALAADPKLKAGYLDEPEENLKRIEEVIDASIEEGLYVLVDWHSHHAEDNEAEAIEFFQHIANKYGKNPHIIYEIYNEPLKISWSEVVKPYSERLVKAIREIDPDNIIVIGTPTWSQDVDIASEDPIEGYGNLAYALHFYAGTHKANLRKKAQKALDNGIALMVTEWGTINANGDGEVDVESVKEWLEFMKENKLIHLNWSVCDKKEGASIVKPSSDVNGNWTEDDLTPSGKFIKEIIGNWNK